YKIEQEDNIHWLICRKNSINLQKLIEQSATKKERNTDINNIMKNLKIILIIEINKQKKEDTEQYNEIETENMTNK
ncbi:2735_t:CDS:2, partial [Scutellospora calospora]